MARAQDANLRTPRARRSVPVLFGTATVAVLSLVAVGASAASADSSDGPGTSSPVVVECHSDVVNQGDVSMSAMSVTRVDAVPSELAEGCRIAS